MSVFGCGKLSAKAHVKTGYYRNGNALAFSQICQLTRTVADITGIFVKVTFLRHTGRIRILSESSPPFHDLLLLRELLHFMGFREAVVPYGTVDATGHVAFDVISSAENNRVLCLFFTGSELNIPFDSARRVLCPRAVITVCNSGVRHNRDCFKVLSPLF
jgi:hypothetical protein